LKNSDSTFGVLAAAVYQKRSVRRDGVEVLGYFVQTRRRASCLRPRLIGSALFQQVRERTGGNIAFPVQAQRLVRSDAGPGCTRNSTADNLNENFLTWGSRALANGGTLTNTTVVNGTAVAGTMESRRIATTGALEDFGAVYDAIDRFAKDRHDECRPRRQLEAW
jgi:iron complex outermembrane receptor protein